MFRATEPDAPRPKAPPPAAIETEPARTSALIVWPVIAEMVSALPSTLESTMNACAPLAVRDELPLGRVGVVLAPEIDRAGERRARVAVDVAGDPARGDANGLPVREAVASVWSER